MAWLQPQSPAARLWVRSRTRAYLRPSDRIRRATGILFTPSLFTVVNPLPANISSQATTTQTLNVTVFCTMTAKLWGGGGGKFDPFDTSFVGGGGGYAEAVFNLSPGDVVTYAAGGRGLVTTAGSSGSGARNGGAGGSSAGGGGGGTELYINGVPVLVAGGGGGGCTSGRGGGGGGLDGENAPDIGSTSGGDGGSTARSAPGDGGSGSTENGSQGGFGGGGNGASVGGGGGGGGWWGGGGGAQSGALQRSGGGGGSGYDSTGSGTLTAATDWHAANSSDPDRVNSAGDAEQTGLVVLKFAA